MRRPILSWKSSTVIPILLVFLVLWSAPAAADESPQAGDETADLMKQMREEIEALKEQVRSLGEQVEALKASAPGPAAPPAQPAPQPSVPVSLPPLPPPPPSAAARMTRTSTVQNPAISAVFQAIGTNSINHDREEDGFSLDEAELSFQAVVDPYARVDLFLTFTEEGAEVEEGFVTTTGLAGGLQVKGGRFKNAFGKWNTLHDHAFFTVERPNALANFFGEESLTTDGVSLSWLVPGTGPVFVESISEIGSTSNDVSFNGESRDALAMEHLGSVFTLTDNATLGVGLSAAFGRAGATQQVRDQIAAAGLAGVVEPSASLASDVFGADVTYKWKPLQYNVYRSITFQAEALLSKRRMETLSRFGDLDKGTIRSTGGYVYGEYQFAKRWRAALRYDASQFPDDDTARERAISAILRITPTEFQEFRIQFKHTGRNAAAAALADDIDNDNEVFFEWVPVIGSHPAHKY